MATADTLELQLLDPNSRALVRLFRHETMAWEPPPSRYRNLRVDPPDGSKEEFAVLYTADALPAVAAECRILRGDHRDRFTWLPDLAAQYHVVRYGFDKPALFIPIDGKNRNTLGLAARDIPFGTYEPFQRVSQELHRRFGGLVHGLSWDSFHRNQPGRIFALWHEHKITIGLKIISTLPYVTLDRDSEWKAFLASHPDVEAISS